jgi:hypothetical protein
MTITETISESVRDLPLKDQVKVLHLIHGLSEGRRKSAQEAFSKTYGALSEADGEAFEEAIVTSRPLPAHG